MTNLINSLFSAPSPKSTIHGNVDTPVLKTHYLTIVGNLLDWDDVVDCCGFDNKFSSRELITKEFIAKFLSSMKLNPNTEVSIQSNAEKTEFWLKTMPDLFIGCIVDYVDLYGERRLGILKDINLETSEASVCSNSHINSKLNSVFSKSTSILVGQIASDFEALSNEISEIKNSASSADMYVVSLKSVRSREWS